MVGGYTLEIYLLHTQVLRIIENEWMISKVASNVLAIVISFVGAIALNNILTVLIEKCRGNRYTS